MTSTTLKKHRRGKKSDNNESGNSTFDHDQDTADYCEIEGAYNALDASEYRTKDLVERKADSLFERYQKENRGEDQASMISTEMRNHFPKRYGNGKDDMYEGLRNYISKILGDYKGGIYTRKYDKKTIQENDAIIHPYEDCDAKTQRFSKSLDEIKNANKHDRFSISRNGRTHLATSLSKIAKEFKENCDKDKIPSSDDERPLEDLFSEKKVIRLEPDDIPEDEQLRLILKLESEQHLQLSRNHKTMSDSLIIMNYISKDTKLGEQLIIRLMNQIFIDLLESFKLFEKVLNYFRHYHPNDDLSKLFDEYIQKGPSLIGLLNQNFRDNERAHRAGRSVRLHDKLSDSA